MSLIATKCICGEVTVDGNDFSNSMSETTFEKEFPELQSSIRDFGFSNCNHCVNHFGIDLCGCGSGNPVGACDAGFDECINNIPSQVKGIQKQFNARF